MLDDLVTTRPAPAQRSSTRWQPRSATDLAIAQLAAVDAWHRHDRQRAAAEQAAGSSREMRLDAARRREVRRLEHAALLDRARQALERSAEVLAVHRPRAVVAHRNSWLRASLANALRERDVLVVGSVADGAEAAAAIVLEQPELVFLEDRLPVLSGLELVGRAAELCPGAFVAAQAQDRTSAAELRSAGAHLVCARSLSPAGIAGDLVGRLAV